MHSNDRKHRVSLHTVVIFFIVFACLVCGCDSDDSDNNDIALERARQYTQWYYNSQLDQLWAHFAPEVKAKHDLNDFMAIHSYISDQLGRETRLLKERVTELDQIRIYERSAYYEKLSFPIMLQWTLDSSRDYVVAQIDEIRPLPQEAENSFLNYQIKTDLRLPFNQEWVVLWGGRSIEDNYHADTSNQRFATDFLILRNGRYYTGNGDRNEEYLAFGQPILAPANGVVLAAENNIRDEAPGANNLEQVLGNHVVIDFENGEYGVMAHFKQGSVTVRAGERIRSGQLIGLCGNSGASEIPHLHFHLQNTKNPLDCDGAQGLPMQFRSYSVNGKAVSRGEPIRWQKVKNQ